MGRRNTVLSKTLNLTGRTGFAGPLAWIQPGERFPEGAIVSGGLDALVLLWDLRSAEVVERMTGHRLQVTGIIIANNGDVVSCSMDRTIRRWRKGHKVKVREEAHKAPIQAILNLSSDEFVTGSADSTIKKWKGMTCLHTFVGHSDIIRALAVMPGTGILSASHDCSIKLWASTGQNLQNMIGHDSLVYSVDSHSSGFVASGSKDCFLKIWKDGICIQSIEHPGRVLDVKFLENGNIITACSDRTVRLWTSHSDCVAEPLDAEAFALELSAHEKTLNNPGESFSETTIAAFVYRDMRTYRKKLILAADGRTTNCDGRICTNFRRKIVQFGSHCLFSFSGSCEYGNWLICEIRKWESTRVEETQTIDILEILHLYQRKPADIFNGSFCSIVAGRVENDFVIYTKFDDGDIIKRSENTVTIGSGYSHASGLLEVEWRPFLDENMATLIAARAILIAATEDVGSGGTVSVSSMGLKEEVSTIYDLEGVGRWLSYTDISCRLQSYQKKADW